MKHPEAKKNEEFVGNTAFIHDYLRGFKTARLGKTAYDIDGKKMPYSKLRPLFIGKSEYGKYDRVMMARMHAPYKKTYKYEPPKPRVTIKKTGKGYVVNVGGKEKARVATKRLAKLKAERVRDKLVKKHRLY